MEYFSRRNAYVTEYSGHEEISDHLRERILLILSKYTLDGVTYDSPPRYVQKRTLLYNVQKQFPKQDPFAIIKNGLFHESFTVVEIFLELTAQIQHDRRRSVFLELDSAFKLSGAVYRVVVPNKIELQIDNDAADKINSVKEILSPYPEFSHRFFQAVGDLVGRRSKPEDVVKDIYVATEGYLKNVTDTSRFGDAIKELSRKKLITKEQKKVLEALQEFRSDADGAGHAGNSETPNEETALWFLDTIVAQLRMIDKKVSKKTL